MRRCSSSSPSRIGTLSCIGVMENPSPKKRIGLYLRVSTSDGRQTNENQRLPLVQLAQSRGYEIVEVYEDMASGRTQDRPAWKRLRLDAHRGRINAVAVVALDRIGRNMMAIVNEVMALDQLGCTVISVREPWLEMDGALRPLILSIFGFAAQLEVDQRRARVVAGLERAKKDGKRLGRPPVVVDIKKAYQLVHDDKLSLRQASRRLGIGCSTLHRLLADHDRVQAALGGVPKSSDDEPPDDPQDR